MNPSEKTAADGLSPEVPADSGTAADATSPSKPTDGGTGADESSPGNPADGGTAADGLSAKAPVFLAAVLLLCALASALWLAQIRADNREAEQLCEAVSLLIRDELTCHITEDPASLSTAGFQDAGNLDSIALSGEVGRKMQITVDTGGTPYLVTVQVQGADGSVAAESRFTVWPLADPVP